VYRADAEPLSMLQCVSRQPDRGSLPGGPDYLDVLPADTLTPAGSEGFEHSLLRCETGREAWSRIAMPPAVLPFRVGVYTPLEAVVLTSKNLPHSPNLDDINSNSYYHLGSVRADGPMGTSWT